MDKKSTLFTNSLEQAQNEWSPGQYGNRLIHEWQAKIVSEEIRREVSPVVGRWLNDRPSFAKASSK